MHGIVLAIGCLFYPGDTVQDRLFWLREGMDMEQVQTVLRLKNVQFGNGEGRYPQLVSSGGTCISHYWRCLIGPGEELTLSYGYDDKWRLTHVYLDNDYTHPARLSTEGMGAFIFNRAAPRFAIKSPFERVLAAMQEQAHQDAR